MEVAAEADALPQESAGWSRDTQEPRRVGSNPAVTPDRICPKKSCGEPRDHLTQSPDYRE